GRASSRLRQYSRAASRPRPPSPPSPAARCSPAARTRAPPPDLFRNSPDRESSGQVVEWIPPYSRTPRDLIHPHSFSCAAGCYRAATIAHKNRVAKRLSGYPWEKMIWRTSAIDSAHLIEAGSAVLTSTLLLESVVAMTRCNSATALLKSA